MGYCIDMNASDFNVKAENKPKALAALQAMWTPETLAANNPSGGSWSGGKRTAIHYSWLNNSSLCEGTCSTFEQGMDDWRYPVECDEDGNVIGIDFHGEKIGDEDKMFAAIAPFVEDGSYLEMHGEDGSMWRWAFKGGVILEQDATITWG